MKKTLLVVTIIILMILVSCSSSEQSIQNDDSVKLLTLNSVYTDLVLDDTSLSKTSLEIKLNSKTVDASKVDIQLSNDNILLSGNEITANKVGKSVVTVSYEGQVKTLEIEVFKKQTYTSILDESMINYYGRIDKYKSGTQEYISMDNVGSGFDLNFLGTSLSMKIDVDGVFSGGIKVDVDGKQEVVKIDGTTKVVELASKLENKVHRVKVGKMSEQVFQKIKIYALRTNGALLNKNDKPTRKFEFYGDSITCGYGNYTPTNVLYNNTDGTNTYATMLGAHYDAEVSCVAYSGIAVAFRRDNGNYLMKEIYDTISAINKTKYDYNSYQADIVFVNLGTNDSAFPDVYNDSDMGNAYLDLLTKIRNKQPTAYIFCMYGMMGKFLTVEDGIIGAVDRFKQDVDTNIGYYYVSGNTNGTNSHPDLSGHISAYEQVVKIIDDNNILK